MTPSQRIIWNVLYDRLYKWEQPITTLRELAEETRLKYLTVNRYLNDLNKMGKITIKRNGSIIRIINV